MPDCRHAISRSRPPLYSRPDARPSYARLVSRRGHSTLTGTQPAGVAPPASKPGLVKRLTSYSSCAEAAKPPPGPARSEEHTSELQSRENLVCRLLLEK